MCALKSAAIAGAVTAWVALAPAVASEFDGSKPLICAALQAIACSANGDCKQGTVESLNIPQFFWVDVGAKTVSERDLDGQVRTSAIQTTAQSPTNVILQGVTERLGWSATISKASGRLTVTGTEGASAMVIFGACTPTR
jgi:hypothetical protein